MTARARPVNIRAPKWDPKFGNPHDWLRGKIRQWTSPSVGWGIHGTELVSAVQQYVKAAGVPLAPGEVEQIVIEEDRPASPSPNGKIEINDVGLGWRLSITTVDPKHELVLWARPTRNATSIHVREAMVDGQSVARDSTEKLDSMNQREFVANALGKRSGWGKDSRTWLPLIEAAVIASRSRSAKTGETWVFDLTEAQQRLNERGPGFVATPFIRPGTDSVLYGPSGRAKTKIVHGLDLGLATAKEVIPGMFAHVPEDHEVEPINVLHIQLENPRDTIDGDIYRIAKGISVTVVGNLHLMTLSVPFLDAVEQIAEYVKVKEIDHASIDSVQTAIGASGASAGSGDTWGAAGEAYFDALAAIRHLSGRDHLSTLSVDHSKGQPEVLFDVWADRFKETLYGSSRKYARFRAAFLVLNLKGRDNPNALTVIKTIGVFNHKPWPDLPRADNAFIEIAFDNAAFTTTFSEVDEPVAEGEARLTGIALTIQTTLGAARHRMTVRELEVATGKSRTGIISALTRNPGAFRDFGSTGWGLVAWGEEMPSLTVLPAPPVEPEEA